MEQELDTGAEYVPGELVDLSSMSASDLILRILGDRARGANGLVFTSGEYFEPPEGWDGWCIIERKRGKTARILRSLSKTLMSFDWKGGDEEFRRIYKRKMGKLHYQNRLQQACRDWYAMGRCFIEPGWVKDEAGNIIDLAKIKVIPPSSVRIFWNDKEGIESLQLTIGKNDKYPAEVRSWINSLKPRAGDEPAAFVQMWENSESGDAIVFKPDELIFIPRYPDHDAREGVSLLRENYEIINNKRIVEAAMVTRAKRFIDPMLTFTIAKTLWNERDRIKGEIKAGRSIGMDVYVPEGVKIEVLDAASGNAASIPVLNFIEDQYNASMGWADSFTESGSSNRSVGEVQLQFWERDIEPEREQFAEILHDRIHVPLAKALGLTNEDDCPEMDFADLTPDNKLAWAQLMSGLILYMDAGQIRQFFEYIGLPVTTDTFLPKKAGSGSTATGKGAGKDTVNPLGEDVEQFAKRIRTVQLLSLMAASPASAPDVLTARKALLQEIEEYENDIRAILSGRTD